MKHGEDGADRVLRGLSAAVCALVLGELLSSLAARIFDLQGVFLVSGQRVVGVGLLVLSSALAAANWRLTRHPFFEYWLIVMAGIFTGLIYAV